MARTIQNHTEDYASPVQELIFHVPELRQTPIVGGGCCALPADFLIEEALKEVMEVREVVASDEESVVRVWVTEGDTGLIEELKDRIEGLTYRVAGTVVPPS